MKIKGVNKVYFPKSFSFLRTSSISPLGRLEDIGLLPKGIFLGGATIRLPTGVLGGYPEELGREGGPG